MNWVKARAQALPPLPGVDPGEVEWVEGDELCTFIGKKSLLLALDDRSTQTAQNLLRNYRAAIT